MKRNDMNKSQLPSIGQRTQIAASSAMKIEPQVTESQLADDIIYVSITIPVSISPRGRNPPRCDLKLEKNRWAQRVVRQIYDGCDSEQQLMRNGSAVTTPPKSVLKVLEAIDEAIKKATCGKAE